MYRNIVYNNRQRAVTLWTWDEAGNRVEKTIPFKPHIYFEHKNGKDGSSIFKTPLKIREFETEFDRRKFVQSSGMKRIFNNLPPEQQFLIEKYGDLPDQSAFVEHDLRVFYLDIEVYSPDEFPKAEDAKHPVNLITIYDTIKKKYRTWGTDKYTSDRDDVIYKHCRSEPELFREFMKYWTKNYPDVLTNWNGDGFDIPYIVNRMERLFGDKYANQLSPTGRIWSVEKLDRFNNPITEWSIQGVSCIDYLKAYKKFSRNERESYTLGYIGELEVGMPKIDHEGSLAELANDDWDTFVKYNIRDVEIMVLMEAELHFLELCRMIAYKGLTKFEKALATNNVVAGAFALQARKVGLTIPTFQYEKGGRPPGGLVRFPENGFADDVASFDAKSLYPNTIITMNLSPETKLGQCTSDDNFTFVTTVRGKQFKLKNDEFKAWLVKNQVCRSVHGTLFSQNVKGIIPSIIEDIYSSRIVSQKKKKKHERAISKLKSGTEEYDLLSKRVQEEDTMQYTLKILMNSIYGTFGNHHSCLYDLDCAASITLTGQESNLQASLAVKNYIKKVYNCDDDLLIYGDTDSIYITLRPLFDHLGIKLLESEERIVGKSMKITDEAMKIITELGGEGNPADGAITKHLESWARGTLNSIDPRFMFAREKISKRGIFMNAKKRYVVQVVDNEGIAVPVGSKKEFSYTGLEVVSSTYAKEVQNMMKEVIQTMIISKDLTTSNLSVVDTYADFCKLSPETLATRKSVKDLKKYAPNSTGFQIGKGTPQNSKASLLYNNMIDHLTLGKQYEKIKSGDKIKILYVAKNRFGLEYVGFKDVLPPEFGMSPDYRKLYLKHVHTVVERMFHAVSWNATDPTKNYECDIISEFS